MDCSDIIYIFVVIALINGVVMMGAGIIVVLWAGHVCARSFDRAITNLNTLLVDMQLDIEREVRDRGKML